jgi:glutathione synthase/RimK-type ligase-like ATP-grasp enzyme
MIVLYSNKCSKSGKEFAKVIGATAYNYHKDAFPVERDERVVCYGVHAQLLNDVGYKGVVENPPTSVKISINKILTYNVLTAYGVPTCQYVTSAKNIPKNWERVVSRETITGRNCEGVMISDRDDITSNCPLYTKFFHHTHEYRIVMWKDEVVARYHKKPTKDGKQMLLKLMLPVGFAEVDEACKLAMAATGLDLAGIDVLVDEETQDFIVLETNSGPLFTDEMAEFFKKMEF